jgi:hypothetical protein
VQRRSTPSPQSFKTAIQIYNHDVQNGPVVAGAQSNRGVHLFPFPAIYFLASRDWLQDDPVVALPMSRLIAGLWQKSYAELHTELRVLDIYKAPDKEHRLITYNFDLERTEMLIPQVSPVPLSAHFHRVYGQKIGHSPPPPPPPFL